MPQATDIVLDGVGYTLAGYTRKNEGTFRRLSGRLSLREFAGGMIRPYQAAEPEQGAGWDGVRVGPVYEGQGLEPFPQRASFTDGAGSFRARRRAPWASCTRAGCTWRPGRGSIARGC